MAKLFVFAILSAILLELCLGQRVTVPLVVGDRKYEISLVPTLEGVQSMALRFCSERGHEVGVDGDLKSRCVQPVAQYLSEAVIAQRAEAQASEAPAIRVPLKLGDKEFAITFAATEVGAANMARQFCLQQGAALGFTEANVADGCVRRLSVYLRDAVRKEVGAPATSADVVKRVSMRVQDKIYDFNWSPALRSIADMSLQWCQQHGPSFGVTEQTLGDCVQSVGQHLQKAAASADETSGAAATAQQQQQQQQQQQATISAKIQIDDNTFEFTFNPDQASARATARKFCEEYGAQVGVLPDNFETGCVDVISATLGKYIR